jgi:hypothetical protein
MPQKKKMATLVVWAELCVARGQGCNRHLPALHHMAGHIVPGPAGIGWIIHLYDDIEDIIKCGQTIVYTIHESIAISLAQWLPAPLSSRRSALWPSSGSTHYFAST